jgi:hypothetical protein
VKVKRDGVEVQNRRGYYAIDPTQMKGYNPDQEVASALGDAIPATLVAFSVQVKLPSVNSVKGKIGVTFLVDASSLSTEDTSAGKRLNVGFFATIYSPDGKRLANNGQKVNQTFPADTYQQILQHGVMVHMDLDPQPGNNQLRLAVQDNRTGLVGTIEAPGRPIKRFHSSALFQCCFDHSVGFSNWQEDLVLIGEAERRKVDSYPSSWLSVGDLLPGGWRRTSGAPR